MKPARDHPHLFAVNARVWLSRLSAREGRAVSLSEIPSRHLEAIAERFDLLWFIGVWRRSPAARERALADPENVRSYDEALPDWSAADVGGSPYAVHGYELDPQLGSPDELGRFRDRLHELGLRLVVDFVTNHLAMDHPWTVKHPERFVHGTEETIQNHPERYFRTPNGECLAHGRDPNFPPWSDTAQVDLSDPGARKALRREILSFADAVDGVRCDTAMLGLSDVFEQVWGSVRPALERPTREFWSELIASVKRAYPELLFIAEAYWGVENRLLELGFDYAYDKRLYDLFLGGSAGDVRHHLATSGSLLRRAVRFIENHDEVRASVAFGRERSRAAAIATMTLPGLRLVHDGQIEGRRIRLPVQLLREPVEPVDEPTVRFYDRLLALANAPGLHEGTWRLLETDPLHVWDESYRHIVAWGWTHESRHFLVALNHSGAPAHGRVCQPPEVSWPDGPWRDLIDSSKPRDEPTCEKGIEVHLDPWSARLIASDAPHEAVS